MRINLLDIGAANQRFSDPLKSIEHKKIIGFEPDARSQIHDNENVRILPYALAGSDGVRDFYLTKKPECSSLLRPNRNYLDRFPDKDRWDIVGIEELDCKTLNSLSDIIGDVDFIAIDIQGAEYEVLGSAETVLSGCLGIECEVEFLPVYEGQPLFGDVCKLLKTLQFEFYDFVVEYRYNREQLNRTGQLAFADALFLRTPEFVYTNKINGTFGSSKCRKYCEIVNAYGKHDLANVLNAYLSGGQRL
jgi:FkbM family methyltransferase